jgi:uncharacterized protein (DUF2147 family)
MLQQIIWSICFLFLYHFSIEAEGIVGFWKTIDDETGKPQSIVAIYSHQNKYYGKLIATYNDKGETHDTLYNPKDRAPGVVGNPYYAGLDIIWNLKKNKNKYVGGKIIDPEKGKIYDSEAWIENGNLIVRGKIFIFGKNQTWPPATDADFPKNFQKPDLTTFVPTIPRIK